MIEYLKAHKDYLWYLLKHKYWVWRVGRLMALSGWRMLVHDLSKFLPSEWFGYVKWKYEQTQSGGGGLANDRAFGWPWFLHTHKRNSHHWQYYMYTDDSGETYPVEIPFWNQVEMVVDWSAAGLTRFGRSGVQEWYDINKDKLIFHPTTRGDIESLIGTVDYMAEGLIGNVDSAGPRGV